MARGHTRRDWSMIDPLIDNLKAQGWNDTQIAKDLGIGRQTICVHLSRPCGQVQAS
jgi:transcriptional regulator of acetoin/glycerol metabolism